MFFCWDHWHSSIHYTTNSRPFPWFDFLLNLTLLNIGFHGASATGVACWQGTLTSPDTWSRPLGLASVLLVETNPFPNLSLFYQTVLFEYPSVLSRFCLEKTFITLGKCCTTSSNADVTYFRAYCVIHTPLTNQEMVASYSASVCCVSIVYAKIYAAILRTFWSTHVFSNKYPYISHKNTFD